MYLVDRYWTGNGVDSDTNSIGHNNTSAFNYRVVPGTDRLSNHAMGFAIDLNPVENPYVQYAADGSFAVYYKDMELYIEALEREAKTQKVYSEEEVLKKFGIDKVNPDDSEVEIE